MSQWLPCAIRHWQTIANSSGLQCLYETIVTNPRLGSGCKILRPSSGAHPEQWTFAWFFMIATIVLMFAVKLGQIFFIQKYQLINRDSGNVMSATLVP